MSSDNVPPSFPPPPPGQPAYSPPASPYAHWGKRVGGYFVDYAIMLPGIIIQNIGTRNENAGLTAIGGLLVLGVFIWNVVLKQGRTGQTVGKGVLGIKLVDEASGQPIGPLKSFLRQLAHIVDTIICLIGYLFPLWDAKRQTIADKIMKTVVLDNA